LELKVGLAGRELYPNKHSYLAIVSLYTELRSVQLWMQRDETFDFFVKNVRSDVNNKM